MDAVALFEVDESRRVPEPPKLKPDQRRAQLQAEKFAAGYHPITGAKLHEEAAPFDDRSAPGRRCGSCVFRRTLGYHNRSWPKCLNPGNLGADELDALGHPYVSHGAATDCRGWFPACSRHSYGDTGLSDDAARCVPEAVDA